MSPLNDFPLIDSKTIIFITFLLVYCKEKEVFFF